MIEVENTDVNIVRNFIPMRNHMPVSAYGLKAISDWFNKDSLKMNLIMIFFLHSSCTNHHYLYVLIHVLGANK